MGNRSNLLTLRRSNILQYGRLYLQEFLYNYEILKLITLLFVKKKFFLVNSNLLLVENKIFLTFFVFFRVAVLSLYAKVKKNISSLKKNISSLKKNISSIFQSFKCLKKNLIVFTVINLNFFLKKKKKKISLFFKTLKRDGLKIFPRRFKFFLDFIQLSLLLTSNKLSANFFVKIFAEIFRILQKKMHSKFFNFVNTYLKFLISNSHTLKGLKFIIAGKLKGKPRSNIYACTSGRVPIQTLRYTIDYAKTDAHTIYGVFGIKLWIYK